MTYGRRAADVWQFLQVLHVSHGASRGGDGLGGPLVGEHPVVLLALDLHKRHDGLQGAGYVTVLQLQRLSFQSTAAGDDYTCRDTASEGRYEHIPEVAY